MSEIASDATDSDAVEPKPKRTFPTALTIMVSVGVLLWIASFFIPAGEYVKGADGKTTYQSADADLSFVGRLIQLVKAPLNGLYGIRDATTGFVGPYESGFIFGSAQVFAFILAIGALMTVVIRTGALTIAIQRAALRFRTDGIVLVIGLIWIFGFLGSLKSWGDETIGMYPLLLPLIIALGYDRLVAVAVISVAPFAGSIGSVFNPFRIGVASDAAGVDIADGAPLRMVIFVVTMAIVTFFTVRYGQQVRKDPATSQIGFSDEDRTIMEADAALTEPPKLTGRHKLVLVLLTFTFALMVFSLVPWSALLDRTEIDPVTNTEVQKVFSWDLGWWMPELAALFIVMAVVIGIAGGLREGELSDTIVQGMKDFAGPAILILVARGIAVILTNTKTLDTILHWMEQAVSGTHLAVFVILFSILTLPLAFLVGSGSAAMALVMPVLAPLGSAVGTGEPLIITMYNSIGGVVLLLAPTNALLMAGLILAKVNYGKYIRFMVPMLVTLFVALVVLFLISLLFT
ncbi:Na+/H+ antiporter NhaC family protein [Gordonia sp. NPDC003429]